MLDLGVDLILAEALFQSLAIEDGRQVEAAQAERSTAPDTIRPRPLCYMPGMIARNWGRVLFLSSESSIQVPPNMIHYAMTKTAYLTISRGLAKRAAGTGVTVNAILPGPTLSEGLVALLEGERAKSGKAIDEVARDFIRAERPSSIIQRPAPVEEVASLAVYVASPLASAITGAALRVDGGVVEAIA
ncbi:hypothetical protein BH10PSE15_BH10PSE15_08260 [soil metagenome]